MGACACQSGLISVACMLTLVLFAVLVSFHSYCAAALCIIEWELVFVKSNWAWHMYARPRFICCSGVSFVPHSGTLGASVQQLHSHRVMA